MLERNAVYEPATERKKSDGPLASTTFSSFYLAPRARFFHGAAAVDDGDAGLNLARKSLDSNFR